MLGSFGAQSLTPAYAAYQQKEHWSERQVFDERGILRSQFVSTSNLFNAEISDETISNALNDSEHKISSEFKIPKVMQESVSFWMKIYSKWSTRQVILFDANHMDTIYEVIDLRALAAKSRNQVVYEILSDRLIKKTLEKYRKAFKSLERNSNRKSLSREENIILNATKHMPHRHSFKELQAGLKVMRGQRDQIISGLVAGENYLPKMEKVFQQMNVPVEITRLALVESSFNIKAGSRVGARGMWQIMPATGKSYLSIDESKKIDERVSPIKSTIAAAKLLKWNYKYLGSWILSIISYNHGHSGMPRFHNGGFDFSKIAYLFEACSKAKHLGFASRNYYAEFLAVVHAVAYQEAIYGKAPKPTLTALNFHRLEASKTALAVIAEKGISAEEFKTYNPDIADLKQVLKKGFWVVTPGEKDNTDDLVSQTTGRSKVAKAAKTSKVTKMIQVAKKISSSKKIAKTGKMGIKWKKHRMA